jgi:hypothetical protein
MHAIVTITGLTLHEARSRKILLAALIFGLIFLVLFTTGLYFIDRLENARLPQRRMMVASILMAGLYAVNFLTIMTAVLVPADTLSGEISSGIIQTLVSKPLRRWEVVLGKWIGFWIILLGYLALMAGGVLLATRIIANYIPPNISTGLALMCLEGTLLLTLSIAGGTRLSTITNGVMVFGMYGVAFIGVRRNTRNTKPTTPLPDIPASLPASWFRASPWRRLPFSHATQTDTRLQIEPSPPQAQWHDGPLGCDLCCSFPSLCSLAVPQAKLRIR